MRRASQEQSSFICTTFTTPPAEAARGDAIPRRDSSPTRSNSVATEVLLLPNGTFVSNSAIVEGTETQRCRQLAIAIRQRIESRLAGRIRNLAVRIVDQTIYLQGECFTYYSKQLAQHAALGVLNDEHLENHINVVAPR